MTANLVTASLTPTGATASRTFGDRFADVINVKDYGAKGDGINDDTSAIQAAINALGTIFFPPGTYKTTSRINLPIGATYGGERWRCFGYNALIKGNFADWLFRRDRGTDNYDPKGFEGIIFENDNAAGGLVNLNNSFNASLLNCQGTTDGLGFVLGNGTGNGSYSITNCKVYGITGPQNSVGIAMASIGGIIQGCDVTGLDRGVTLAQTGSVSYSRFETNVWAVGAGCATEFQILLSVTNNGAGKARINLSNTLLFRNGDSVLVSNLFSAGSFISGTQTITAITATYIDTTTNFSTNTIGYADGYFIVQSATGNPGGGNNVIGNEFEANGHCVYAVSPLALNIIGNFAQIYRGATAASAGMTFVNIHGAGSSFIVQGNRASGQAALGGVYWDNQNTVPFNYTVQSNSFQDGQNNLLVCYTSSAVVNPQTNIPLANGVPYWLSNAFSAGTITVMAAQNCVVPAATTVSSVNSAAGTITLSTACTGTMPQYGGFAFASSGGTILGMVSLSTS